MTMIENLSKEQHRISLRFLIRECRFKTLVSGFTKSAEGHAINYRIHGLSENKRLLEY